MAGINVYEIVTDRLVSALNAGTVPWRKPWNARRIDGETVFPSNVTTRRPYRGVNVFLLACAQAAAGYAEPYWLTFNQARGHGGRVRKGEHGMPVIFWNWHEKRDRETGEPIRVPFLRYYVVFNVAQVDGVADLVPPYDVAEREHAPIAEADALVRCYRDHGGPAVQHGHDRAAYSPSRDAVIIPDAARFVSTEAYYAALFHELGHSTGHAERLARPGITDAILFGSHAYSREELVAEMTSAFCSALTGCWSPDVEQNSAAYLAGWIKALRGDAKLAVVAAAQAQRAADMIQGRPVERTETEPAEQAPEQPSAPALAAA